MFGRLGGVAVPYALADVFAINRDLFYGLYALAVIGLFASWSPKDSELDSWLP